MPKFISERDVAFFKGLAREVVDDVIQNAIVLFKINLNETRVNLYGESINDFLKPRQDLAIRKATNNNGNAARPTKVNRRSGRSARRV
jgi:hypothetical protein